MPEQQAGQKIEFVKSRNFLRTWSPQIGEICSAEVRLLLDRAPPPIRGVAAVVADPPKPAAPAPALTRDEQALQATWKALEKIESLIRKKEDFQRWLKTPSPSSSQDKKVPAKTVPPFDLQDIPGAMRKIGAPVGAALMERWFAGALNYAPTSDDEIKGINQDGVPFPIDMIDTTSITMEWVMKFSRAQRGLEALKSQLETPRAQEQIIKKLYPYRQQQGIRPWMECRGDIIRYHKDFQFQMVPVEGTLSQKMTQFAMQSLFNNGLPDDLTCALGSFNLYAGISQTVFGASGRSALVTHINVYVKDNFTFTDKKDELSQYLGHWNRHHVAIFPSHELARRFNVDWLDHAVFQDDLFGKDAVLYPVKNSDFRDWQRRHCRGGDFIIYSDIMNIQLDKPIRVYF